jgi:hypothetical protein
MLKRDFLNKRRDFDADVNAEHADGAKFVGQCWVGGKDVLLHSLATQSSARLFQRVFDSFVREVCAPKLASMCPFECDEIYYQAFPCVRIVQPDEFSIGPHCDVCCPPPFACHHPYAITIS